MIDELIFDIIYLITRSLLQNILFVIDIKLSEFTINLSYRD